MLKILFVVPYVPSLVRVRPYNLIRQLSKLGDEVTVLTLATSDAERADARALAAHCHAVITLPLPKWRSLWNCLVALPSRTPLQARFAWQPALAHRLQELLSVRIPPRFDLLHVEHLRGALYGVAARRAAQPGAPLPIVWDSVDCISHLFEQAARHSTSTRHRWITAVETRRTRRYEGWLVDQFDQVLVTSPVDREALLEARNRAGRGGAAGPAPVQVLPNGVDLEYFRPEPERARRAATLVISGKMSYHANVAMVLYVLHEVMPLIWHHRPDVELCIVGKDPPPPLVAAAAHPRVEVTGTVDDIRPYLQRATLALAPITYGAGIQNKILEAMACGTPVVTSPQAATALAARPERDLRIADTPGAVATTVLELLDHPARREQLSEAGRRYVERHHDWRQIAAALQESYHLAIEGRTRPHPPFRSRGRGSPRRHAARRGRDVPIDRTHKETHDHEST